MAFISPAITMINDNQNRALFGFCKGPTSRFDDWFIFAPAESSTESGRIAALGSHILKAVRIQAACSPLLAMRGQRRGGI